jgi:hypothetical protein
VCFLNTESFFFYYEVSPDENLLRYSEVVKDVVVIIIIKGCTVLFLLDFGRFLNFLILYTVGMTPTASVV